jgi:hypothetical protein
MLLRFLTDIFTFALKWPLLISTGAIKTTSRCSSATAASSFLAGGSGRGVLKGSSREDSWRSLLISVAPLPIVVVLWTPVVLSGHVVS